MKIQLTGYIDVPADRLTKVSAALPEHIRLTRAETGCISFDVTPSPDVAGRFDVSEVFADRSSFDAHQKRAGATNWAKVTKDIPRQYQIVEIP
ncbi:MAG TPA: antibiotic biosynthesis monooxygenase [Aliiroseovarius sp.]|nr:antibiotic biosynthesis monooxygenase [Aliiroseovarius sp.]